MSHLPGAFGTIGQTDEPLPAILFWLAIHWDVDVV
jgi:hypothetical protein